MATTKQMVVGRTLRACGQQRALQTGEVFWRGDTDRERYQRWDVNTREGLQKGASAWDLKAAIQTSVPWVFCRGLVQEALYKIAGQQFIPAKELWAFSYKPGSGKPSTVYKVGYIMNSIENNMAGMCRMDLKTETKKTKKIF